MEVHDSMVYDSLRKLKIYLDTSIINFLFADDTPDFKKITEDFFKEYFSRYDWR